MEKRALIAIILSFVVMALYWYIMPQPKQQQKIQTVPEKIEETAPQAKPDKVKQTPNGYQISELPQTDKNAKEEIVELNSKQLKALISNIGGGIKEVEVKTYHDRNNNPIVLSAEENPFDPLTIAHIGNQDLRKIPFEILRRDASSVVLRQVLSDGLEITKTIRLRPQEYLFEMDLVFKNTGPKDLYFQDGFDISVGGIIPVKSASRRGFGIGMDLLLDNDVKRLSIRKFKSEHWEQGNVQWAAVKNQFCAFILKPDRFAVGVGGSQFPGAHEKEKGLSAVMRMDDFALIPGESKQMHYLFYAGPKEYDTLKAIGHEFYQVMDFGKYLRPFSIFILKSLLWIYSWSMNYGIAIILLTLFIKVLTLPLTHKSFKSMKEMQVVQPELSLIREKYKNNPKKMQAEMMALYKEHKINPLGGCLPMVLQMPILIAFFRTLNNAVELKGAPFMLWINDLSAPDHLFTLPFSLPIIGNAFNVLPLFMVVTFVIQQRMSSAANKAGAVTEQQQQQQKMMQVFMPIIFGVLFYNMPSGLVLYFTVSTLLGLVQQYYILKKPVVKPAKVAV